MIKAILCLSVMVLLSWTAAEVVGHRQFKYVEQPENWHTANEKCAALGMQLLTITNRGSLDEVSGLIVQRKPNPSVWVAASDLGHEGTFIHITNGQVVPKELFSSKQPDNAGGVEHCVEATLRWSPNPVLNDIGCANKFPYICEEYVGAPLPAPSVKPAVEESCGKIPTAPPPTFCTSVYRC